MTTYKIGDTDFVLEEIFAISDRWGEDANRVCFNIFSKDGAKVRCTMKAKGQETKSPSDGHDPAFLNRADSEIEEFKIQWQESLRLK